jgi:spermidine/putrescine transport system permease protein
VTSKNQQQFWLASPLLIWFVLLIATPTAMVFLLSFASKSTYGGVDWTSLGFSNYARLLNLPLLKIFFRSFGWALATASLCVFIGLITAWAIAASSARTRNLLIGLVALPFVTNSLIRIMGIKALVAMDGPLIKILNVFGVEIDPFALTANQFLVGFGLITTFLPFAILPLYAAFEKFDFHLIEAGYDLGASNLSVFFLVIFPAMQKALAGAFVLVFVPCLGEYLIPDLLGGAKTTLIGNMITEQFLKFRDWPYGSALATVLVVTLLCCVFLIEKRKNQNES